MGTFVTTWPLIRDKNQLTRPTLNLVVNPKHDDNPKKVLTYAINQSFKQIARSRFPVTRILAPHAEVSYCVIASACYGTPSCTLILRDQDKLRRDMYPRESKPSTTDNIAPHLHPKGFRAWDRQRQIYDVFFIRWLTIYFDLILCVI